LKISPVKLWKKLRGFVAQRFHLLVQLHDTPHAIAGGVAIGIFIGFMPPILPAKTLLSIGIAWIFRCSKVAAAISVAAHDLLFLIWPLILRWEFIIGYWLLHHHMPAKLVVGNKGKVHIEKLLDWHTYRDWTHWIHEQMNLNFFERVVGPALIGWVVIGIPASVISYALTLKIVKAARAAKLAKAESRQVDPP
jgi:hypothetical protein